MAETSSGPTGPGSVVLDIGGDVGALIIITPARMAGEEIHISPLHDPTGRTHALVRQRRLGAASCHAAVYPALPEGDYTIWRGAGSPAGTVHIGGGAATSYRWAEPG